MAEEVGMIDISDKDVVEREATAVGSIMLKQDSIEKIREGEVKKGDVPQVAEIAAIQAVKNTPDMIPHCHNIPIEGVDVRFDLQKKKITVRCTVRSISKTGVEMEALAGVNMALLTVWDMVKYIEKDENGQYPGTKIEGVSVKEKKKGGKDGT